MAKGYNIYTGVERTPPALRWMLHQRQYIHGEIVKLEKLVAAAPAKLVKLRAKLAAVDETIGMHELQIDLGTLPPKRKKAAAKVQLPYGAVVKVIWSTLRENGNQPLKTSRFTQALIATHEIPVDKEIMHALRRKVIMALNDMTSKGHLCRLHPRTGNKEGTWALPPHSDGHIPRAQRSYRGGFARLAKEEAQAAEQLAAGAANNGREA